MTTIQSQSSTTSLSLDAAKEYAQIAWWVAGLILAVVAIGTLLTNLHFKRREEKWTRIRKAEQLVDDLFQDEFAHNALRMLDGSLKLIRIMDAVGEPDEQPRREVNLSIIEHALKTDIGEDDDHELAASICHCYDVLLYFFHRLEIYVSKTLIKFDDVRWPMSYYATHLLKHRQLLEAYADKIDYPLAIQFILRFQGK